MDRLGKLRHRGLAEGGDTPDPVYQGDYDEFHSFCINVEALLVEDALQVPLGLVKTNPIVELPYISTQGGGAHRPVEEEVDEVEARHAALHCNIVQTSPTFVTIERSLGAGIEDGATGGRNGVFENRAPGNVVLRIFRNNFLLLLRR